MKRSSSLIYSIIIPVFNKAALTRHCLSTLRPTLEGAGEGEIIVVDNASTDDTPRMLEEFPWAKVIRNEQNLGFAGANNQAARMARGEFLVLLNNDTEAKPGWLATMLKVAREENVGVVGARLLFPTGRIQHAGVVISPVRVGRAGFLPFHDLYNVPGNEPYTCRRHDFQIVTGACMLTPRKLYEELGGLDEAYWNGYEDVDYCLKVRDRGLRVVYAGDAVVTHYESQSGSERFRKVLWNMARLADRWNGRVRYDLLEHSLARGVIGRTLRTRRGQSAKEVLKTPRCTVAVHGLATPDARIEKHLRANHVPIERILWLPAGRDGIGALRDEMEVRGDRYLAVVNAATQLRAGWLDELVRQVEFSPHVGAAAYNTSLPLSEERALFTASAGCALLSLSKYPAHLRLADSATMDGSLADFLIRGLGVRAGVRAAALDLAQTPGTPADADFEQRHGTGFAQACNATREAVERALSAPLSRSTGLVSIVMLSWNAPEYTKMALESIRTHTRGEYEVIIVDNGSGAETTEWLATLAHPVRVIFNATNRGYAGGNNDGMAAARGDFVVLLNNDVIVTEGWLEGLLDAFQRIPGLGVSAPRSNIIAGDQVVTDATYANIDEMHTYAAWRRDRYRGRGYMTDRAIGLCLCVDRRVIDEIGGIDERFGVGNFEDDDFCLRVRAAGYRIHVCDEVFIHHFGSKTFAANKVDWQATMRENWSKFALKWELPPQQVDGGYQPQPAIRRGFVRSKHYFALPPRDVPDAGITRVYETVFAAIVRNENDWESVGNFLRRYVRAFDASHAVLFAIGVFDEVAATDIGARANRIAAKEGLSEQNVPDVLISDETTVAAWMASLPEARLLRVNVVSEAQFEALEPVTERSPSALRRLVKAAP